MDIKITGQQLDLGESLMLHVKQTVTETVTKYFQKAVSTSVIFTKDSRSSGFKVEIITNDGKGHGIVKGNDTAHDIYVAFDNALKKISTQLNKYKARLNNHHKASTSDIASRENNETTGKKSIFAPYQEHDDVELEPIIIAEKPTDIEKLSVKDAVMKMDLNDLPTLLFINSKTDKINCVYYRKDGNISWVEITNGN